MAGRSDLRQRNKSKNKVRVRSPNKGLWSLAAHQSEDISDLRFSVGNRNNIIENSSTKQYASSSTIEKSLDSSASQLEHTNNQELPNDGIQKDKRDNFKYRDGIGIQISPTLPGNTRAEQRKAEVPNDGIQKDKRDIFQYEDEIGNQMSPTLPGNAIAEQRIAVCIVKFLESVKPFWKYLPKAPKPSQKIELNTKVVYTAVVLFFFMGCSKVPLFYNKSPESIDPFYHMRVTWASYKGTCMEFGIMPIAASQTTLKIMNIPDNTDTNDLFNGAQRLFALVLTVVLSGLFIITGMFGELGFGEFGVAFIISMELLIAGLFVIWLNDLVKKGYCLGTEISLFVVANVCGIITWKAFSPVAVNTEQGEEYEGAFVFLLHLLSTDKSDKMIILKRAFFRENLPNLWNFLATFFVFVIVIYLKGVRVKLHRISTKNEEHRRFDHINLLYTSVVPLYLQSYFVPIFNLFAQVLSAKFKDNFFVNLLGVWAEVKSDGPPRFYPIGGLCYYLSPPRTPLQRTQDPVYGVVYTVFMIASCVLLSIIGTKFVDINTVDDASKLTDKSIDILDHEGKPMSIKLGRFIPMAAVFSGLCIGILSVLADFVGVFVSGTKVIAAAISIYDFKKLYDKY